MPELLDAEHRGRRLIPQDAFQLFAASMAPLGNARRDCPNMLAWEDSWLVVKQQTQSCVLPTNSESEASVSDFARVRLLGLTCESADSVVLR